MPSVPDEPASIEFVSRFPDDDCTSRTLAIDSVTKLTFQSRLADRSDGWISPEDSNCWAVERSEEGSNCCACRPVIQTAAHKLFPNQPLPNQPREAFLIRAPGLETFSATAELHMLRLSAELRSILRFKDSTGTISVPSTTVWPHVPSQKNQ